MKARWLLTGALALAACTEPRQLVLSVRTTAGVPCDIDHIRVVTRSPGATTTSEQPWRAGQDEVEITLFDDTPGGTFDLELSGLKGDAEVLRVEGPLQFSGRKAVQPVLLDARCEPGEKCPLSGMAEGDAVPALACRNVTRYKATRALERFENACTTPGNLRAFKAENGIFPRLVQLTELEKKLEDSNFEFYGRPVRQVWVAKDGYLSFATGGPEPGGQVIPPGPLDRELAGGGFPPPRQSVMAFWDELSVRSEGVCYSLTGDAGSRKLVVTWERACLTRVCEGDNLNFSITLDERDNHISITYGTMGASNEPGARGLSATAGLVNDATGCTADQCNLETGQCRNGKPCGYSQVFSNAVQEPQVEPWQFTPVVERD